MLLCFVLHNVTSSDLYAGSLILGMRKFSPVRTTSGRGSLQAPSRQTVTMTRTTPSSPLGMARRTAISMRMTQTCPPTAPERPQHCHLLTPTAPHPQHRTARCFTHPTYVCVFVFFGRK